MVKGVIYIIPQGMGADIGDLRQRTADQIRADQQRSGPYPQRAWHRDERGRSIEANLNLSTPRIPFGGARYEGSKITKAQQMFFIGLIVGGMIASSGGSSAPAMLAQIPLRCLVAFDQGDEAYKNCRRLSLAFEIVNQWTSVSDERTKVYRKDVTPMIEAGLELELTALRAMAAEAAKQKAARQ